MEEITPILLDRLRNLPIADEQPTSTIGTVVLRGRSLTRANKAFLSQLRAQPPVRS
jgi:hypothetical protein